MHMDNSDMLPSFIDEADSAENVKSFTWACYNYFVLQPDLEFWSSYSIVSFPIYPIFLRKDKYDHEKIDASKLRKLDYNGCHMYDQSSYIFSEDRQRGTFSANSLTTKYKGFVYLFFILFDFLTVLFWFYNFFLVWFRKPLTYHSLQSATGLWIRFLWSLREVVFHELFLEVW